jgi:hypothetical protein
MRRMSGATSAAGQSRAHQALLGHHRIRRRADGLNHFVDIGDRDGEAHQDMGALARLA